MPEHDLIVIGLGPGGEEVAKRAAEGGLDVLAIDRRLVGGECPYWGCIPSKVMVRAADSLAEAARAIGLAGDVTASPEWAKVAGRVREVTADWNDEIAVRRHLDHLVDDRLGHRARRGGVPRGAAALAGVGVEGELADHEDRGADVGDRALVLEDA